MHGLVLQLLAQGHGLGFFKISFVSTMVGSLLNPEPKSPPQDSQRIAIDVLRLLKVAHGIPHPPSSCNDFSRRFIGMQFYFLSFWVPTLIPLTPKNVYIFPGLLYSLFWGRVPGHTLTVSPGLLLRNLN